MEFQELNLHPDLQRGIAEAEYRTCMPVQEQVLANAFGGQDLYVQSQTGTGKTAAFLIVIFQRLLTEPLLSGKKAIIMVPTRELAVQVEEEAIRLGKYLPFKAGSFYGGVGYGQQTQSLKDNAQILVGTPGRVLDLNQSGHMNLMDAAFLVLDEADRMFDMGFYPDLRKLLKVVPPADRRQTMLFSATLNAWVKNLAWEYTSSPLEIEIAPETVTVDEVEQLVCHVSGEDKMKVLLGLLAREQPESAIIFCNTKRYTEIIAKRLKINGYECEFIIGDLPQSKRLSIIEDLKAGTVRYLVATDVAARGLDIEGLALVINYDLPGDPESYIHRIGRTARAGKTGKAITLVSEQDVYELPNIEKYIGKKIPAEIAGEALFRQDKSEGIRIQTDYREDPESRRESRASPQKDRESRRRKDPPNRQSRNAGKTENRPAGKTGQSKRKPPEVGDTDLSHLSFDERMAYYKQKYGGKSQKAEGNRRRKDRKSGKPGTPKEPGTPKPPSAEPVKAEIPTPQESPKESGGIAKEPEKKGLIARIFDLFK
ncbi:MAG: DEAD/DEAH box helicase [Spirochaetaceae bacterium]|jgi:ATP-dependent RNA helicase RhlB|nr:DEAD/DEAH box helicase [Spirochaetaceae bacterium]